MPPKKKSKKPKKPKKPKAKVSQSQKQTVIVQIGRDGLRPRKKRKKTKRPASKTISAVSGAPETTNYMRTIQTPTIPTLITGLSIRSQADLQEQLRIKQTTERQDVKLYPPPTPASFKRRLEDEELVEKELVPAPAEEVKQAEEPEPSPDFPRMPLMRMTPSSLGSIAEQGEFTGYFSREDPEERPLRPPARPPVKRAPKGGLTVDQLKVAIKETGYVGYSNKNKKELQEIAEGLGINPFP